MSVLGDITGDVYNAYSHELISFQSVMNSIPTLNQDVYYYKGSIASESITLGSAYIDLKTLEVTLPEHITLTSASRSFWDAVMGMTGYVKSVKDMVTLLETNILEIKKSNATSIKNLMDEHKIKVESLEEEIGDLRVENAMLKRMEVFNFGPD